MTRLHTPVEERVTDPDRWHPRQRRRIREWAETRVFWRRGAPTYPTREARAVRATPRDVQKKINAMAAGVELAKAGVVPVVHMVGEAA